MFLNYHDFLNESKLYQGKLNPEFWKDEKLDPEVREKLLQIAKDFYKDLKVEAPIEDIHLTGSLANFNWTKYSDLDVHVLLDFTKIGKDKELAKRAMDGERFIWNLRHPVSVRDHDVELYAQDIKEPHVASGLFSLKNNAWITKPTFNPPHVDPKDISRKAEGYIAEIKTASSLLSKASEKKAKTLYERIGKIKDKIMKSRKEGLADDGEFSIENLTFKKLRNEGWIEKLIDLSAKAYSKIYSE